MPSAVVATVAVCIVAVHWPGDDRPPARPPAASGIQASGIGTPAAGSSADRASAAGRAPLPAGTGPADPDFCAGRALARMSRAERAGQAVMIGIGGDRPDRYADPVRRHLLGSVFLTRPATGGPHVLARRIRSLQEAANRDGVRLHVSVDQEGGAVQTLVGGGFTRIPSATVQGAWSPATLARRAGLWAQEMSASGITMNLAPVADTVPSGTARRNPPIGRHDRQYGDDPGAVAADVAVVVAALQKHGVTATAKHFPGLGRVRANTDFAAGALDPGTTRSDPALHPFSAAVRAGAGAVMISSARYPALDPSSPAMFSRPIVTGLLRIRLGFEGLIVSDDLGAAVAVRAVPVGDRAVRFIAAGGDLVLSVRTGDAGPMTRALVRKAARSNAFAHRLDDAARHVLIDKVRRGLLTCP